MADRLTFISCFMCFLIGWAAPAFAQLSSTNGGVVLLTFDTEFDGDAEALSRLDLDVPATFFWTGAYAQRHPDLLREIAADGHAIGSHSFHHDNLTNLTGRQVQLDLELSKLVLEQIACVPVSSFRAPFLEYTDAVMKQAADLNFAYDSSDRSSFHRNPALPEIAVSAFENLLVSDYDIFEIGKLDDQTGLDFLIRAFDHHAATGRPFVVLLHPRFIGQHAEVLHHFIAYVQQNAGQFLTLDDYVATLSANAGPSRLGLWLETAAGWDADTILAQATLMGATDVFLPLPDDFGMAPGGRAAASLVVAALQANNIRVHVELPMSTNPALAASRPGTAMVNLRGTRSDHWVSPSHPEVRRRLIATATEMVTDLGIDGLHLVDIGYPDLSYDFSAAAIQRFGAATGVAGVAPQDILALHYLTWINWRADEVATLVQEIGTAVRSVAGPDFELSASLVAEAAINFRTQERTGQDFARLGGPLDLIVPKVFHPFNADPATVERTLVAIRTQIGSTALLSGFDLGQLTPLLGPDPAQVGAALRQALVMTDGAVFSGTPVTTAWHSNSLAFRHSILDAFQQSSVPFHSQHDADGHGSSNHCR